ncbi:hypothetical protein K9U39_19485 [Rhodoblastus acidophilus]|uniref:Uncharacterized protein n=1 Tax=Candidatus Rhodoblastus alkanivorans TaxID=2954117 RepID=A0ABS9Z348_9HYPH|nr:hypothetical protein [Candidatus Rhodoblastus alkanivorans]MCI4677303.1 hypothetical protein [Candidatus Rhodoblastus alkanivorans]MCI4682038.1 hypothetical protein [Candidatus Rhodoblastus alkanivorans]MDI4643089.1 hypothetical protein [Rhodoblastus acidophilus]
MTLAERIEYSCETDRALNYCLWEYDRPAPAEDKFRSINLLYNSFAWAGVDAQAYAMVDALREKLGPWRSVFGVKQIAGRLAWEFYFYDYQRRQREISMSRVLDALAPLARCRISPPESLNYFMFSLDIDDDLACGRREIDVIHMYVGNPGSDVSSGVAYALRAGSTRLENFYFFFDATTQLRDAAKKIANSGVFDETIVPLDAVLRPELRSCRTICVANKQTHDCVYFSGIDVDQLIWFLEWQGYPQEIKTFVHDNRSQFDHLLFDAGFDYRLQDGALQILKSGYYGVF